MFRPFPAYVGYRYTRAKRRNHFISFITLSSFVGIAIGVWALITVLSVMNGFQQEIRERILGAAAHATISGASGQLHDWQALVEQVQTNQEVVASAPYILKEGMLSYGPNVNGAIVRGVLPDYERRVSEVGEHMIAGDINLLKGGQYGIVLGRYLARAINAQLGDKITLITPSANVTPAGVIPRLKRFTVVGIFELGMNQYDNHMALIHMQDAGVLYKMKDSVSGLRLKMDDLYKAPRVSRDIASKLPGIYYVRDWTQHHANLFRAIQIEKTAMFVILSLIVAVAAFNIVSTLVIVVNDKQSDIAILRTFGASPGQVMQIFIVQGVIIGLVGTLLGTVTGVLTAQNVEVIVPFLENLFGIQFLDSSVYLISDLPSDMRWSDVTVIAVIAFSLTVLATIYPAWRASRVQPAEALRYE